MSSIAHLERLARLERRAGGGLDPALARQLKEATARLIAVTDDPDQTLEQIEASLAMLRAAMAKAAS